MKVYVIHTDSPPELRDIQDTSGVGLGKLVGGWLEHIRIGMHDHGYMDEDAKIKESVVNPLATVLCWRYGNLNRADCVRGTMVVLGYAPPGEADITPETIERIETLYGDIVNQEQAR